MGMFDHYRPARELRCLQCGAPLTEWQGKDGPCALFVWVEHRGSPVEQLIDDELKLTGEELARQVLPPKFTIYSYDCPIAEHRPTLADCAAPDGVWSSTQLRPCAPRKG